MRNSLFIIELFCLFGVGAADYPSRPLRTVVAYAAGGTTDFTKFLATEIASRTRLAQAGNIRAG